MSLENSPAPAGLKSPPYLAPFRLDRLAAEGLSDIIRGRELYVWGGAFVGQGLVRGLMRQGFKPRAILDQSPRLVGRELLGLPVLHPEEVLSGSGLADKIFVFMASGYWEHQMARRLEEAGLTEWRDYWSSGELAPVQPAVEIAGACNLRCQGCPRGNLTEHPPRGFMSAADYGRVLDKLLTEIPFLGAVQLYVWGEPLLNPEFSQIVRLTRERGVLSIVSTNLNTKMSMEELLSAAPDMLRLSASGFGPEYEITHTGGNWERFLGNFCRLAELRPRLAPDMAVELYYHLYRHNGGESARKMKALAGEAGFMFRPVWGCLYPWDNLQLLAEGRPLSETAARHLELVIGDLPAILKHGQEHPDDPPCNLARCFPIDWDRSVLGCGTWYRPRLVEDYLTVPLADILQAKIESPLCRRCAGLGIHQVNFPFMADRGADIG